MPRKDELEIVQAMLRANPGPNAGRRDPVGVENEARPALQALIGAIRAAAQHASRDRDHATYAALHIVEMKLNEVRIGLLEAQKLAKGEALELVRMLLEIG